MTAQQSVMNSLFTAFAGFTALGAAIVAVLAGGSALQSMADRWVTHAPRSARSGQEQQAASAAADLSGPAPGGRTGGAGLVIKLRLGGDALELTGVSPAELRRLTGQWLDCHATGSRQTAGIPADERD